MVQLRSQPLACRLSKPADRKEVNIAGEHQVGGSNRAARRKHVETGLLLVGAAGIEPATTCSQSRYATAALRPEGVELSHAGLAELP